MNTQVLTTTEAKILTRCVEIQRDLAANRPELWRHWGRPEWVHQIRFGPDYKPKEWFGRLQNREIVKYRRTIKKLEQMGLMETYARWDDRLTNVKVTRAGRKAAAQLLKRSVTACRQKQT